MWFINEASLSELEMDFSQPTPNGGQAWAEVLQTQIVQIQDRSVLIPAGLPIAVELGKCHDDAVAADTIRICLELFTLNNYRAVKTSGCLF
jgi:hypothetical protein